MPGKADIGGDGKSGHRRCRGEPSQPLNTAETRRHHQAYPLLCMRPMVARWLVQPPRKLVNRLPTGMDGAGERRNRTSPTRWQDVAVETTVGDRRRDRTPFRELSFPNVSSQLHWRIVAPHGLRAQCVINIRFHTFT